MKPQLTGEAVEEADLDLKALYPSVPRPSGERGQGRKPTRERRESIVESEYQFFTIPRRRRNLNRLQAIADNLPVKQTMIDKDGNPHEVKLPRYSGREQIAALRDLLDRDMGKPVQAVAVGSVGSAPLTFQFIIEPPDDDEDDDDEPEDSNILDLAAEVQT